MRCFDAVRDRFDPIWLQRSRVGGLADSKRRFEMFGRFLHAL